MAVLNDDTAGLLYRLSLLLPQLGLTLLEKVFADFALCDVWHYCKALCDVKFRQIKGNGRNFRHIDLNSSVISYCKFSRKFCKLEICKKEYILFKTHFQEKKNKFSRKKKYICLVLLYTTVYSWPSNKAATWSGNINRKMSSSLKAFLLYCIVYNIYNIYSIYSFVLHTAVITKLKGPGSMFL